MSRDTVQPWLGVDVDSDEFDRWLDQLRQVLSVEEWREIGVSGNPVFKNSFANDTLGPTAAFYKDPFQMVRLRGVINTGTSGTVAFTLSEGYRPPATLYFPALQTGGTAGAYVEIQSDGDVIPVYTGAEIHLNNISFRI